MSGESQLGRPQLPATPTNPSLISDSRENLRAELAKPSHQPMVLDFYSQLDACSELKNRLALFSKLETDGKMAVRYINVEDSSNKDLIEKYGITVDPPLPTLVFIDSGGKVKTKQCAAFREHFKNDENIATGLASIIPNATKDQVLEEVGLFDTSQSRNFAEFLQKQEAGRLFQPIDFDKKERE